MSSAHARKKKRIKRIVSYTFLMPQCGHSSTMLKRKCGRGKFDSFFVNPKGFRKCAGVNRV